MTLIDGSCLSGRGGHPGLATLCRKTRRRKNVQDEYEDLHRRHERRQRQMSGEGRGGYSAAGGGWGQGGYGRDPDERWPDEGYQGRGYGGEYERGREERAGHGQFGGRRGSSSATYAPSWQTPGEHSGRGPKGYKRSDERVRDDVSDRLEQSGSIDASEIEVDVKDGIVTLRGSVSERTQKRLAEEAADSTPGVRDVRNEVRVAERDARDSRQAGGTQQGRMGSEPQAGELPSATAARSQTGSQRPATRGGQASEGQATQPTKGSRESQARG
jgi:hypothetical protein